MLQIKTSTGGLLSYFADIIFQCTEVSNSDERQIVNLFFLELKALSAFPITLLPYHKAMEILFLETL